MNKRKDALTKVNDTNTCHVLKTMISISKTNIKNAITTVLPAEKLASFESLEAKVADELTISLQTLRNPV